MITKRLNRDNNYRWTGNATAVECTFVVNGTTGDVQVHATAGGGALVGTKEGITAGNVAKISGLTVGERYTYQLIPMDERTGNAILSY